MVHPTPEDARRSLDVFRPRASEAGGEPRGAYSSTRARSPPGSRSYRAKNTRLQGFSLIELLVVVIVIGIIAMLAIPTMTVARFDRRAYEDAGAIMQLLRSSRMRAIARGGAVLVNMTSSDGVNRGKFYTFEAVTGNAQGTGLARTPIASCKTPTNWFPLPTSAPNTSVLLVDGLDLNGTRESDPDIQTEIYIYKSSTDNGATNLQTGVNVCFTPLGRSYVALGDAAPLMFDGLPSTVSPLQIDVLRAVHSGGGATIRSVLLPPNGMARIFAPRHAAIRPSKCSWP
jgi:prepilin-type N-terminal cleavage/methylation domain-containing protein